MYSETTKNLLDISDHMENVRAEIAASKRKGKPVMETLKVRFPASAHSGCEMLSSELENWNKSDIARAAMYLGLKQLDEILTNDPKKANGLMNLIKVRAALGK